MGKNGRIFQAFELDPDFKNLSMGGGTEYVGRLKARLEQKMGVELENLSEKVATLKQELLSRGYTVLESSHNYQGLPGTIIIGRDVRKMHHKQDFYGLAAELKLPYISGPCYFEITEKKLVRSKPSSKIQHFSVKIPHIQK